jgi:PPIC-type PPIASE domain
VIRSSLLALSLSGCVVTTLEGPGEAPRVVAPPGKPAEATPAAGGETPAPAVEAAETSGPERIAARHLLVAYRGALRAGPQITRTREEALARAEEAAKRAKAGEPFEDLVREYSDEPGAAARGGDLGLFRRADMVRAFSEAAFALKPGEVSDVVSTEFGFHVIQRTE